MKQINENNRSVVILLANLRLLEIKSISNFIKQRDITKQEAYVYKYCQVQVLI